MIAFRVYSSSSSNAFEKLLNNYILNVLPNINNTERIVGSRELKDKLIELKKNDMIKCLGILHKSIIHY